jgi:hypothetical protein
MAKISYQYNIHNGGRTRRHKHRGFTAAVVAFSLTVVVAGAFWGYELYQNSKSLSKTNVIETINPSHIKRPANTEKIKSTPEQFRTVTINTKQTKNTEGTFADKPLSEIKKINIDTNLAAITDSPPEPEVISLDVSRKIEPKNVSPSPIQKCDEETALQQIINAENSMKENLPVKTVEILDKLLESGKVQEYSPLWLRAVDILNLANTRIILTDVPYPIKKVNYMANDNDVMEKIAAANNTSIELLQCSNNLKSTDYSVWSGRAFRIYKGDWKIKVSKKHLYLHLYDGNRLFKVYRVGIGREDRTPEGKFVIVSKVKEPAWYSSTGKIVPYGSPSNVIGTRWLKLLPEGDTDKGLLGYGIHGTWDPDSIGKTVSNGCIRMKNHDVEELFMIVPRLTSVTISQ